MHRLEVHLRRLTLQNPILVASGTFGYAREMAAYARFDRLGGIVPKTVTLQPRAGNPPPRTVETSSGLLNSIGLDNDGLGAFLDKHLDYLSGLGSALIVNIAGHEIDEFARMAERLDSKSGIAALELNISCPNVSGGIDFATQPEMTAEVVSKVVGACRFPVIAKLTPNVTDVVPIAQAAGEAGADAVSLINTLLGMAIDWRQRRAILGNTVGGLSGPAIKPVALRIVWQVAQNTEVPIIGVGGIQSLDDVMDFLVAGASAVQIGTANFYDPTLASRVVDELEQLVIDERREHISEFVGTLQTAGALTCAAT